MLLLPYCLCTRQGAAPLPFLYSAADWILWKLSKEDARYPFRVGLLPLNTRSINPLHPFPLLQPFTLSLLLSTEKGKLACRPFMKDPRS